MLRVCGGRLSRRVWSGAELGKGWDFEEAGLASDVAMVVGYSAGKMSYLEATNESEYQQC